MLPFAASLHYLSDRPIEDLVVIVRVLKKREE
jgi:hypothetical protein